MRYTYRIVEYEPGTRMVMSTAEGPFPMTTEYTWRDAGADTMMTLRNHGQPSGFSKAMALPMSNSMRRAMASDLAELAAIVERPRPQVSYRRSPD